MPSNWCQILIKHRLQQCLISKLPHIHTDISFEICQVRQQVISFWQTTVNHTLDRFWKSLANPELELRNVCKFLVLASWLVNFLKCSVVKTLKTIEIWWSHFLRTWHDENREVSVWFLNLQITGKIVSIYTFHVESSENLTTIFLSF